MRGELSSCYRDGMVHKDKIIYSLALSRKSLLSLAIDNYNQESDVCSGRPGKRSLVQKALIFFHLAPMHISTALIISLASMWKSIKSFPKWVAALTLRFSLGKTFFGGICYCWPRANEERSREARLDVTPNGSNFPSQAWLWALGFQMEEPSGFHVAAPVVASCICGIKDLFSFGGQPWWNAILQKFASTKGVHDFKLLSPVGTDWSVWRDAGVEETQAALSGACGAGRRGLGELPILSAPGLWIREDLGLGKREARDCKYYSNRESRRSEAMEHWKWFSFCPSVRQWRRREWPSYQLTDHYTRLYAASVKGQLRSQ